MGLLQRAFRRRKHRGINTAAELPSDRNNGSGFQRGRPKRRAAAAQPSGLYRESGSDGGGEQSESEISAGLAQEAASSDSTDGNELGRSRKRGKAAQRRRTLRAAVMPKQPARNTRHTGREAPGKYAEVELDAEGASDSSPGDIDSQRKDERAAL